MFDYYFRVVRAWQGRRHYTDGADDLVEAIGFS